MCYFHLIFFFFWYELYRCKGSYIFAANTWSVQKTSRNLNFRGLRIFNFRFFWGVMLVLMSLTYADKLGHFECSINFWQLFCLDVFWLVFDFCLFQKMDQRFVSNFVWKTKLSARTHSECWLWHMVKLPWTLSLATLARQDRKKRAKFGRMWRFCLQFSSITGAWCIMSSCHRVERSIRNITCKLCAICAKQSARNAWICGRTKISFCTLITLLLTHRCLCANFLPKTTH